MVEQWLKGALRRLRWLKHKTEFMKTCLMSFFFAISTLAEDQPHIIQAATAYKITSTDPAEPKPSEKIMKNENLLVMDITPFKMNFVYQDMTLGNWLLIKPEDGGEYKPGAVTVESKAEPIVTKEGDKWVIKFKKQL